MQKEYELYGCTILVSFKEHSVHIVNDKQLWKLLSEQLDPGTTEFAILIHNDFQTIYQRELKISVDALVVEIWGHVYFEYFALAIHNLFNLKLIERLVESAATYSEIIDCGETGYDNNRWLWDMLAPHKERIARWLPENINDKNWKE